MIQVWYLSYYSLVMPKFGTRKQWNWIREKPFIPPMLPFVWLNNRNIKKPGNIILPHVCLLSDPYIYIYPNLFFLFYLWYSYYYKKAYELKPSIGQLVSIADIGSKMNHWENYDEYITKIMEATRTAVNNGNDILHSIYLSIYLSTS